MQPHAFFLECRWCLLLGRRGMSQAVEAETIWPTETEILSLLFSCSVGSNSATPWAAAHRASLPFTVSQNLHKLMSIESMMPSNHLILCRPLLLLPSIFPNIGVFSDESVLSIRWPKYWSFSFSVSPSNEYSVFVSLRMDWFDLLAVQGTLKTV